MLGAAHDVRGDDLVQIVASSDAPWTSLEDDRIVLELDVTGLLAVAAIRKETGRRIDAVEDALKRLRAIGPLEIARRRVYEDALCRPPETSTGLQIAEARLAWILRFADPEGREMAERLFRRATRRLRLAMLRTP